jgi:hypothetical protein
MSRPGWLYDFFKVEGNTDVSFEVYLGSPAPADTVNNQVQMLLKKGWNIFFASMAGSSVVRQDAAFR